MTTRRQTVTLVSVIPGHVVRHDKVDTMDIEKLLWATGVSHQRREKRKKSSDDASTNGDPSPSVLRSEAVRPDNVEDDGQRKTAVGNWPQSPDARKAEKNKRRRGDKR